MNSKRYFEPYSIRRWIQNDRAKIICVSFAPWCAVVARSMFLSSLDNKWNPFFLFFKIIVVKLSFILSPVLVKSRITRAHVHPSQLWKLRVYNRRMTILSKGSARQVIKLLSLLQCSWQWEFHLFLETNKRNSRVTMSYRQKLYIILIMTVLKIVRRKTQKKNKRHTAHV